ncbi:MAG: phage minor capsid protein [Clostridium sp.]|nr:phage minor capsid protein [Clostridium sp.]
MINDASIDELIQPILNLYSQMELDLMIEVAKRFAGYDKIAGSLEWQLKKLEELGGVNKSLVRIIKHYTDKSESEIKSILQQAGYANLDTDVLQQVYDAGLSAINPEVLMQSENIAQIIELSYKSLTKTFSLINTKALESAKQKYLNILNTAYLDTATGIHSLQESCNTAIQQMAKQGIGGATYKRGNRYVTYSIEGTVRRDTLTAVHQLANKVAIQSCEDMGTDYVEISQHLGARVHPTNPIANHAGWQGKVFKINGRDNKYPNLKASTGYPDDILGLGGVNCRHRMFPFFPGISISNPIHYDEEKNRKVYESTQHQRKLEREMRTLKKRKTCADAVGDTDTSKLMQFKIKQKDKELDDWCSKHNLRRDYSRELVSEQLIEKNVANKSEDGIIKLAANSPYNNIELEYNPDAKYEIKLDDYSDEVCKRISKECKNVAEMGYQDNNEHLSLVNLRTGETEYVEDGTQKAVGGTEFWNFIQNNKEQSYAFVHNHNSPTGYSETDLVTLTDNNCIDMFVISRYDGKVFILESNGIKRSSSFFNMIYAKEIEEINKKVRNGEYTAGERTFYREKMIVENAIRDYTKGLKEFG